MLQEIQIVSKFYNPLVTIMGLDYNSITKSTAARILSHETPELAADYMYDLIEDGMKSEPGSEAGKKFWEDVIAEMVLLDQEFATEVSKAYFKMVVKNYMPSKP